MKTKIRIFSMLLALAVLICLGLTAHAQVVGRSPLAAVSPVNNAFGMPLWYQDQSGRRLELCLDPPTLLGGIAIQDPCLLDGLVNPAQPLFLPALGDPTPANFPGESFYYMGDAIIFNAGPNRNLRIGLRQNLEVAFLGPIVQGAHILFSRIQVDSGTTVGAPFLPDPNARKLTPNATYTFTFPMGVITAVADATGTVDLVRHEVGCGAPPCNPAVVLVPDPFDPNSNIIGPNFLGAAAAGFPGPIAGYTGTFIGDPFLAGQLITPGVNGAFFRADGPNVGGPGINTIQTTAFNILGKQFAPPVSPGNIDFNADNRCDILFRHALTGQNAVWMMDGTTFTSGAGIPTVADANWKIVGAGDFNGDNQTDILWRHAVTGFNAVWMMNGTTFVSGAEVLGVADVNWEIVEVRDMNGDNSPDILWRHAVTGANTVFFMTGTTVTSVQALPPMADLNWKLVGAADLNADGQVDLLWRNAVSGQNVVWFMNGTTLTGGAFLPTVLDVNWRIRGIRDYTGDGRADDILWQNGVTGGMAVWRMNGTAFVGGVILPNIADVNWQIVAP